MGRVVCLKREARALHAVEANVNSESSSVSGTHDGHEAVLRAAQDGVECCTSCALAACCVYKGLESPGQAQVDHALQHSPRVGSVPLRFRAVGAPGCERSRERTLREPARTSR